MRTTMRTVPCFVYLALYVRVVFIFLSARAKNDYLNSIVTTTRYVPDPEISAPQS